MLKQALYKIKWKFNIGNIQQRYANFCGRVKRAKNGEFIAVDSDVLYIHGSKNRIRKEYVGDYVND